MQSLGNILQKNNNNEIFSNILAKQYAGSIGVKTKIMKKRTYDLFIRKDKLC